MDAVRMRKEGERMKTYRAFIGMLAGVIAVGCIVFIALVVYVDPFFQYHAPLEGFPYVVDNQLSQNPGLARNTDYNAVLLGSSVTVNFNTAWFEELFGLQLVKLPYNGAYPRDIVNAMELAEDSGNRLDAVFLGIDVGSYSGGIDEIKYELPSYLYDRHWYNDVYYWFNKDVLLNYIVKPFIDPSQGTDRTDCYSTWQWLSYGREETLAHYTPVPYAEEHYPDDFLLPGIERNLDVNICPMIERNPETQFYVFFPPYSILYWYDFERLGQTGAILLNEAKIAERLLAYDNVRVFFFQDRYDVITDLDNYTDKVHYSRDICYELACAMARGEGELHPGDYLTVIDGLKAFVDGYDYDGIWEE